MLLPSGEYLKLLEFLERQPTIEQGYIKPIVYGLKCPSPTGTPERSYWVDKWPDVSMVIQLTKYNEDDVDCFHYQQLFLFAPSGTPQPRVGEFFTSCSSIDWMRKFALCAVSTEWKLCLEQALSNRSLGTFRLVATCRVHAWTGEKSTHEASLKSLALRLETEQLKVGPLRIEDVDYLIEKWEFGYPEMKTYYCHSLREAFADRAFAAGIYRKSVGGENLEDTSKPVAFAVMFHHGALATLITLPEYRRKGLASYIVQLAIDWCLRKSLTPFCTIKEGNIVSEAFFSKQDYQPLFGGICWYYFTPST